MDENTFTLLVKDIDDLRDDIKDLRSEIKSLNSFRWRMYGINSVITGVLSIGLTILINYLVRG